MQLNLDTPVQYVPRVGPVMAKRLEKLGVFCASDLLFYPPFRYNDYSQVVPINQLKPNRTVTIKGTVMGMKNIFTKHGKNLQQAIVADDSGQVSVTWYNQAYLAKIILPGADIQLSGHTTWYGQSLTLETPEYEIIPQGNGNRSLHTGRMVPVYPETAGLSSKWLRGRIDFVLTTCLNQVSETTPAEIINQNRLYDLKTAIAQLHFPDNLNNALAARRRLAFDELFFLQLLSFTERRDWEMTQKAPPFTVINKDWQYFIASLPFTLTIDQKNVLEQIRADLEKPVPANRLVEGDVGSGKTVLATAAIYQVVKNGWRACLMAPTEILASQHFETISQFLTPHGISVTLVTGSHKPTNLKTAQVLVGTHALLSEKIVFQKLGLIVVDEQQRFGANQRLALRQKNSGNLIPHLLTMTATPIPRTVARTIYGNLDLSVLDTLPAGRSRIKTWVVPSSKRAAAYDWIQKTLNQQKSQAFIVCPLVEESENLTAVKSVKTEYQRLKTEIFPNLKLGLLHGKMKAKEKNQELDAFRAGKYDILVCTPVVEVGIDIANATIMLVEAAERFGLSQLHQLRGRVGRGDKNSFCLLFTEHSDEKILNRLKNLETTFSGPRLAEIDLSLRGPGDLFGSRQHGIPGLTFASLADTALIAEVQKSAEWLQNTDPALNNFPYLREKLEKSKIKDVSKD